MPSEIKNSLPFMRRLISVAPVLFSAAASAALPAPANSHTGFSGLTVAAATASPPASPKTPPCSNCGRIESVREITAADQPSGAPPVSGAMDGPIGADRGQNLATALGGNPSEKRAASEKKYEIVVRLDDGSTRKIHETHVPMWRPGDRVSVNHDTIQSSQ